MKQSPVVALHQAQYRLSFFQRFLISNICTVLLGWVVADGERIGLECVILGAESGSIKLVGFFLILVFVVLGHVTTI